MVKNIVSMFRSTVRKHAYNRVGGKTERGTLEKKVLVTQKAQTGYTGESTVTSKMT